MGKNIYSTFIFFWKKILTSLLCYLWYCPITEYSHRWFTQLGTSVRNSKKQSSEKWVYIWSFAPEDTLLSVVINTGLAGIPNLLFHKRKKITCYIRLCSLQVIAVYNYNWDSITLPKLKYIRIKCLDTNFQCIKNPIMFT